MSFAVPFFRLFKYPDQDIQWNVNYKPKIKELDAFIEKYGSKRINLIFADFVSGNDIQIIKVLKEKYPDCNLVICAPEYDEDQDKSLMESDLPYYYKEKITNWDKFNGFLKLKVTDIVVAEEFMFYAKILSSKAKENGKSLRCFCNVCQSSWKDTPSIKTFFIRPEDIDIYSKYIDTFEFFADNFDATRMNTLYEIYTKDKSWYGKLNELIIGYEGEEDNRGIIPLFGEKRIECGKRCSQLKPCFICDRIVDLSNAFQKQGIVVTLREEKKNEEREYPNELYSNKSTEEGDRSQKDERSGD